MENYKSKHRKVCERCLTITQNNKQCPNCGYSHLRDITINAYAGRNKQILLSNIG